MSLRFRTAISHSADPSRVRSPGRRRLGWATCLSLSLSIIASVPSAAHASVGTITEYSIPTANSFPDGIVAGPDGNIWFAERIAGKIGRITTDGSLTEFPLQ